MATRVVTGTVLRSNGSAWLGGIVRFRLVDDTFRLSPDQSYPIYVVETAADATGAISVTLISGPDVVYEVTMPDRETFRILVEDGSTTTLETLRGLYNGIPSGVGTLIGPTGPAGITGPAGGPTGPTGPAGSSTGDVIGQASSVDSEIALFSGTGGKTIKRATGTGVVKVASGVYTAGSALDDLTDVVIASAVEGDKLIHNGTTFINRPSGELAKGRVSEWVDDLDCALATSGAIGRNGWSLNLSGSGAGAAIASETQHPGLYRLSTGATLNSVAGLYNTAGPYLNDIDECEFIFRIGSSLASVQYGVFIADTTALGTSVFGVIFNSANDAANWTTYKTVAGVNTTATFSKAAVVSEWWRAFFKRTGSGAFDATIERMSDNSSATVNISGLTLGAYTNVQFRCVGLATANKTMDPDYCRLNSEVLTRN